MSSKLSVDITKTKQLALKAGQLVFKREAEKELLKLLELQKTINQEVELVKEAILTAGESIAPNFKGVIGENIKCVARYYGAKYDYAKEMAHTLGDFLKEVSYYKVDGEAVDKYLKDKRDLPQGILLKDRAKKLSILLPGEKDDPQVEG